MEINWLGHSCLRIRSRGVTLITDPYPNSLGLSMGKPRADIVTISNDHPHHSNHDDIQDDPRVLEGPGEYEIANYYISGMGTARGEYEGDRRINTVFTFRVEGLTLCHLGDLSQTLSPRQIEGLRQTDILFAPVGGGCIADTAQMSQLVSLIEPRIVVPLHYQTDGVNVELGSLQEFLTALEISEAQPQTKLGVTATSLPKELQVTILQRP